MARNRKATRRVARPKRSSSLEPIRFPSLLTTLGLLAGTALLSVSGCSRGDGSLEPGGEAGNGMPPDGYSINVDSGFIHEPLLANPVAARLDDPMADLEPALGSRQRRGGSD
jgi:hypothetical protein